MGAPAPSGGLAPVGVRAWGGQRDDRRLPPQNIGLLLPLLNIQHRETGRFDASAVSSGCLEGECHYLTGNIRAKKRVNKLKKDLAQMGIEPERLEMFNLSSSEGPWFAAICKEMTDRAYKLGPSPVKREARAARLAAQQATEASA